MLEIHCWDFKNEQKQEEEEFRVLTWKGDVEDHIRQLHNITELSITTTSHGCSYVL